MAGRINNRKLTEALQELGTRQHSIDDDGNAISREAALADLVWKKALGWTERVVHENDIEDKWGNTKKEKVVTEVEHPPENWAMQFIWERREGKAPQAADIEPAGRVKAKDKVRELARERANKLALQASSPLPPPPPPVK